MSGSCDGCTPPDACLPQVNLQLSHGLALHPLGSRSGTTFVPAGRGVTQ